jgi:formylglycine-generating enzyme required for sulfatase activity
LYHTYGFVWEWCQDWWYRVYTTELQIDPTGPGTGADRLVRGGTYGSPYRTRSAFRNGFYPNYRGNDVGARLVRMGPEIGTALAPQSWGEVKEQSR